MVLIEIFRIVSRNFGWFSEIAGHSQGGFRSVSEGTFQYVSRCLKTFQWVLRWVIRNSNGFYEISGV